MEPLWIDGQTLNGFTVEKHEIGRPGGKSYYPMSQTGIGVLHTTESNTVQSAIAQFAMRYDPPHFCVGEGRIIQLRPLGVQAGALHDPANRDAFCQIEIVGFSKTSLWLPVDSSLNPLVGLVANISQNYQVPLVVPNNWPDDCSDCKPYPSSDNTRRKAAENGLWPTAKGWWEHLECPWQGPSFHWDCGSMQRTVILDQASVLNNSVADAVGGMEGEVTQP